MSLLKLPGQEPPLKVGGATTRPTDSQDVGDPASQVRTEEQSQNTGKERRKILHVDQIWDKASRKFRYVKTAKPKQNKKVASTVVTVARRISVKGVFLGNFSVDIRSQHLPAIFNKIYEDIEGVSFPPMISLDTDELYLLYYALPELNSKLSLERQSESPDQEAIFELESVVEFTHDHFAATFNAVDDFPEHKIDYQNLWTLFPPGSLVYADGLLEEAIVLRIRALPKYFTLPDGTRFLLLDLESVDFNGKNLGVTRNLDKIAAFDGLMSLATLPYQPLMSRDNYQELHATLLLRSKKTLSLHGRHLKEYQGHALEEVEEDKKAEKETRPEKALKKFNTHGRVMFDPATLAQLRPNSRLLPSLIKILQPRDMTLTQKLMLNPYLYGFSLGDKTWGKFGVSSVRNVEWNDSLIDSLVLPGNIKRHIQVLVQTHGNASVAGAAPFDDVVKDKGKGLIGLLVGPPGVGKTLTAEVMAEVSHKALYTLSSGELGESSSTAMARLGEVMELAETWKAILLLDEADVFLADRDDTNLSRNSLTSTFLRHLEYFQGIMLLTTNRIVSFDLAFQSRIHFCIEYPDLDKEARASIWRIFRDKIAKAGDVSIHLDEDDIANLACQEIQLNGRQIKNAMSISQSFAQEQRKAITYEGVVGAIDFSQSGWIISRTPGLVCSPFREVVPDQSKPQE